MNEDIYTVGRFDETQPFSISIAGYSYCDGGYRITRTNSRVFCMEYIIAGSGTVTIGGRTYYPRKDDVYMLMYGKNHRYFSDAADPWTKVWFNASGPLIENIVRAFGLYDTVVINRTGALRYFERIIDLCKSGLDADAVNTGASRIFLELIQYLYGLTKDDGAIVSDAAVIRNYMDAHLAEDVSIETLAGLIYKSSSQALRLFKEEFGTTPYSYLLERRFAQAKSLLLNTNLLIKEIAYRTGFSDEHYFSSVFRRKCGVTPKEYRSTERK